MPLIIIIIIITIITMIIIKMKNCKAPTLQLKVLNKHSITHIMYTEMEMLSEKREKHTHNVH